MPGRINSHSQRSRIDINSTTDVDSIFTDIDFIYLLNGFDQIELTEKISKLKTRTGPEFFPETETCLERHHDALALPTG